MTHVRRLFRYGLVVAVLMAASTHGVFALTPTQLSAIKADIAADNTLNVFPNNSDGNSAIAAVYNVAASPSYWVWRTFLSDSDMYELMSPDATSWSWTIYIQRSQAERDAWRQMVNMKGGINPSLANTRTAIADIFSGVAGAAQRTHLTSLGRRLASRVEKLLGLATVGGSGTRGSTANPDTMGFEGPITYQDIEQARNSA